MTQEPMMATVNQMMPLSGQPKRFSFHIETRKRQLELRPEIQLADDLKL